MEKINRRSINQLSNFILVFTFFAGLFIAQTPAQAQIRAGLGYLKMLPGVRGIGLAKTTTAALDFTDSFYANPAATGFLREWQWSASYTNWISEVYDTSFLFGKQVRTPWSRYTRFVLAANYLGIPEFTSSSRAPVSGDHLLATVGIGQPLSWISENISAGANVKYFSAHLADYHANSLIYDVGLLARTPRLYFLSPGNEFLDYAIFSAGISLTNFGQPIQFDRVGTPLPQTLRTGLAVNLGAHRGLQLNLAADYQEIRDEAGFFSLGSEISWQQIFSLRMGYSLEDNLLGNFNFGASVRVDDLRLNSLIPGRNNAIRFDLASNQNNEFFTTPYHASITHQPTGPEYFEFEYPLSGTRIDQDSLLLAWETTRDPDLYDATHFWLIVDPDSQKIAALTKRAQQNSSALVYDLNTTTDFFINQKQKQNTALLSHLPGGHYFWTVLASDKDNHLRFATANGQLVQHFYITQPQPEIIAFDFLPDQWITEDDFQGKLQITVENQGDRSARNFVLEIIDSAAVFLASKNPVIDDGLPIVGQALPLLEPGQRATLEFEWRTREQGRHRLQAGIRRKNVPEDLVASRAEHFYTIPKGTFTAPPTLIAANLFETTFELPYFGKIFFEPGSPGIAPNYLHDSLIPAPLAQFATRLVAHPEMKISLQASIDRNSNEHDLTLADARAEAVRDSLISLGVRAHQIQTLPDTVIQRRQMPSKPEDAEWLRQEDRFVNISTEKRFEALLFGPTASLYVQKENRPVQFTAAIQSAAPLISGKVNLAGTDWRDSLAVLNSSPTRQFWGEVVWEHRLAAPVGPWQDFDVRYDLVVTDSLHRQFKVRPQTARLAAEIRGKERLYFVLAQFKYARAYYGFYWTNLLENAASVLAEPNIRMQFIGHGCAVGSDAINLALSQKRATQFTSLFLNDLSQRNPELFGQILSRIDAPQGRGETEPLGIISPQGNRIILGDNQSPLGRNLNRRVGVRIYSQPKN